MKKPVLVVGLLLVVAAAAGAWWAFRHADPAVVPVATATSTFVLRPKLDEQVAFQRKLVVLFADDDRLAPADAALGHQVGQYLFHANIERAEALYAEATAIVRAGDIASLDAALTWIESAPELYAVDRLAFRELLVRLRDALASAQTLAGLKLHKRVTEDLESFDDIEKLYDKELGAVLGQLDARGVAPTRERWDDYVQAVRKLYDRSTVIAGSGFETAGGAAADPTAPSPDAPRMRGQVEGEVFGKTLPPKTIVLTFDDGPHPKYTDEIRALLKRYDVPGTFFQVGHNLGALDAAGKGKLGPLAAVDDRLLKDGFVIGNHSYTHAQLTKLHEQALTDEVAKTDQLLQTVSNARSPLFRFPYGARNKEGLDVVAALKLTSVMWNVDSLDWADPVPASVADRVLKAIGKEKKGIVLFHDIHPRAIQALPIVLDRLKADGYQFAGWDGTQFSVRKPTTAEAAKPDAPAGPGRNWAVVIGINDYAKWPKLQYAAADAASVKAALIDHLGFAADHVLTLQDKDATRAAILTTLNTKLSRQAIGDADQIFVFFAGHGATRQLASGRSLGYVIPVDADPEQTATEAIAMTDIQNIAESLGARHVFFVMDACYSGLGLARGGADRFLKDNAQRVGRQMLTAGGADQMVADGGPGGHSVFTWTLLQALDGKADSNGDGVLTATEIAAYVAPSVSKISLQTPAFGSLPGSEGGDFVFTTARPKEYLTEASAQLPADALALNAQLKRAGGDRPPSSEGGQGVTVTNLEGRAEVLKPVDALAVGDRQRAEAANNRGLQLYREKQYALAEASFLEALRLEPTYAMAANNLGFVFYREGRHAEAIRWFEATLKLDPSRGVAYLNIGDAWAALGDADKAKAAYRTYLELLPGGPGATRVRQILAS